MKPVYLALGVATLLAACTTPAATGQPGGVYGYHYHDGVHSNTVSGQPSPQAIENAQRGVWLWPPNEMGRRG